MNFNVIRTEMSARSKGWASTIRSTGQIRSNSTADIACWFIDTNYNGESFFVRHAYFTGGEKPYEKLRRALRAEVDEAAWAALYSAESRPFDRPDPGEPSVRWRSRRPASGATGRSRNR